jgi:hypothetical protein
MGRTGRITDCPKAPDALGELTTSIVHEVNQPLGAIAYYASVCRRWHRTSGARRFKFASTPGTQKMNL